MSVLFAQLKSELRVIARNGEQLLVIIGIPMILLIFFSQVDVLPRGDQNAVDFLLPGILALAVMSTAMVSLGIATGFERSYGVLKRLGATPLGTQRLVLAKSLAVVLVEVVQLLVLIGVGLILGWRGVDPRLARRFRRCCACSGRGPAWHPCLCRHWPYSRRNAARRGQLGGAKRLVFSAAVDWRDHVPARLAAQLVADSRRTSAI